MTYEEVLEFLYSQLPMYSRIGAAAYKADLKNTLLLCELLDHPEKKFKSIHIAGTNGKGSTSHMLSAILQTAGFKTGLYTSPHLLDFRERIRINGEMISKEEVVAFVENYKEEVVRIGCSFFEWTVGLAFHHFALHGVDVAVIETGLGGRLDSTNVITPVLSVITNISWDHSEFLGDSLEKIAGEKAGIIKEGIPVVIGERQGATSQIFVSKAEEKHASVTFASDAWQMISSTHQNNSLDVKLKHLTDEWDVALDLTGDYQVKNVATVLEACSRLNEKHFHIAHSPINEALKKVRKLTGLRGRWEVIHQRPIVIADVGHNEAGLKLTLHQLQDYKFSQLRFVVGFVKEKTLDPILPLFPKDAVYYFCKPDIPRGLDVSSLREQAARFDISGKGFNTVWEAYQSALQDARDDDLIYVGGSTFVVAEVL